MAAVQVGAVLVLGKGDGDGSGSRLGFRNGISVRVRFSGPSGGRSGIG